MTHFICYVLGCRAFSVFSPEVFEQALNILKVLNTSGSAWEFSTG